MKRTAAITLLLFGAMSLPAYAGSSSPPGTATSAAATIAAFSAAPGATLDAQKSLDAYAAPTAFALKTSAIDASDPKKPVGAESDITAKKLTGLDQCSGGGTSSTSTASTGVLTATAAPPNGFAREDLLADNCIQTGTT